MYANKMNNLVEMDKPLERHNLPKLNQEEIENMNRLITSTEGESVTLKLLQTERHDQLLHRQILTNI